MARHSSRLLVRAFTVFVVAGLALAWAVEGVASAAGTDSRNPKAAARTSATPAAARVGTAAPASPSAEGKAAAAPSGSPQRSAEGGSAGALNGGGNTANGNKGHIQIEGTPDCGPTPCGNDNDPHVPCTLTVQLFGYPSGADSAVLTITGQAPSGTGTVASDSFTFTGASSPNGSILDTQRSYTLTGSQLAADGLTPQPQQGYHLRVQVAVNGHPAKTHVIWFQPCATAPVLPGSSAGALMPGDTTTADTGLAGAPRPLVERVSGPAALPDSPAADSAPVASSLPDSQALDAPPATTAALETATSAHRARSHHSGLLAFTGAEILMMLAAAAMVLAIGMTLVSLSRRRRARPVTV